ncbi:MAG: hypothetical protein ACOC0Z_04605 [Halohasta sp.]
MVLTKLLGSTWARRLSVVTVLVNGVRALLRGNRRVGALLIGLALLAYRWSPLGILLTLLVSRYGDDLADWALGRSQPQS